MKRRREELKRVLRLLQLSALLIVAFVLYGCLASFTPIDIAGTWSGTIAWTEGPAAGFTTPIMLILTQDGTDITGEIGLTGPGSTPFSVPITEGTAGSSSFTITGSGSMDVIAPPVAIAINLHGDSDGQTVTGTGTQTINSAIYAFTWTATLTAPPPED